MHSLSSILASSVEQSKRLEEENIRLKQENRELKAELKALIEKVDLFAKRSEMGSHREVETRAGREFRELSQEIKEGGCHPMHLSHSQNRAILDKFMAIFDRASEEDKKWLAKEPMCPLDMEFPEPKSYSDPNLTRETTRPLHSVFFLADSEALEKLKPHLTKKDFKAECLFDSSFLHMIISGIKHGAPQGDAPKCAKALLSQAPELREKKNKFRSTAEDFAQFLIYQLHGSQNEKEQKLRDVLDAIRS